MGLFRKKNNSCSCQQKKASNSDNYQPGDIAILGGGCPKCIELENNVKYALNTLNMDKPVKHITDMAEIASFGVMSTPALVINNQVVSYGKLLSPDEIKEILMNEK